MRRTRVVAMAVLGCLLVAIGLGGAAVLTGFAGLNRGETPAHFVTVNGAEPQNPLVPTNTGENDGARIVDRLFAGLVSYDADGTPQLEVAQTIDTIDNVNYRITLQPGWTFSDGSPVTAKSFVDAWNYGALSTNGQLQESFFSPIEGYDQVASPQPTAQVMSGLEVVSDNEFTVRLKAPTIDFTARLGFTPFYPLPESAFGDMAAFGEHPIGNGPYKFAGASAWQHNAHIDLAANADYHGNRVPRNEGLRFVLYDNLDTAYADLLAGKLDVLDTVPASALPTFRTELGDRAMTGPVAQNQTLDTPLRLAHFGGEEGVLRRLAISAAINRQQICDQVFGGMRSPAREFTASSLPGFDPNIPGSDALDFDPDRAADLWEQADDISPWTGQYVIGYSADGGDQPWVDAVASSINAVLGIDAVGAPQPTSDQIRPQIADRSIDTAFPSGRQVPYPSMVEFLEPLFVTGARLNDVEYSNRQFDGALTVADAASTLPDSYTLTNAAQQTLLEDMPVIPLWDYIGAAGRSTAVSDVTMAWNGLPNYERILKS